jgi:hypothetical protein
MKSEQGLVRSIHSRLLSEAKKANIDPNLILSRYALERFLYRLSVTKHRDQFLLKGAMMMVVWLDALARPTRDADLLGLEPFTIEELTTIFESICEARVPPDGMRYDADSIRTFPIRAGDPESGLRLRILGTLGNARLPIQIDVGVGDSVTPEPEWIDYPVLLDAQAPRLKAYRPETSIAEKLEIMLSLGTANSRMKDYFDISELAGSCSFDGAELRKAIEATLRKRGTPVPNMVPAALTEELAAAPAKQTQWSAFLRKSGLSSDRRFDEVVRKIREFLLPLLEAIQNSEPFDRRWKSSGPWKER